MLESFTKFKRPIALCLALSMSITFAQNAFAEATPATSEHHTAIESARAASDDNPASAPLKFKYAEALRKAGKLPDATREFLAATEIDPNYFMAYHQLTLCSPDKASLADAVKRLTFLMNQKPKELMLRVALSELLETQGQYFQASKILVELVYENAVPPKYVHRVNNRIRFLQVKAREHYAARRSQEEKGDSTPLPMPDENLTRGLSASRLEKASEVDGYGHSLLQH